MGAFVPLLVIIATGTKVVDFVRYARAGDGNGILTQLVAWATGFALIALAAHTPWANAPAETGGLAFGGVTLGHIGVAGQLLVGLAVGSGFSLAKDGIKALDGTQSAAVPPLVDPPGSRTP